MPTQQDWMEAQKQRMAPQTPDTIGRMLMGMEHPGSGGNAELTAGDYTLRQRLADILAKVYGGNDPRAAQSFGRSGADLASIAPGSGQILSGDDAIRAAGKGDVSGAALAALGAVPGVGPEARAATEGGDVLAQAMARATEKKAGRDALVSAGAKAPAGTAGVASHLPLADNRIAQRVPTAPGAPESAMDNLLINMNVLNSDPAMTKKAADTLLTMPGFNSKAMQEMHPGERLDAARQQMSDNLLHLYDKTPPEVRARSSQWYLGANKIANERALETGIDPASAAGTYAALSPQKDWFQNVDMGDKILRSLAEDTRFTSDHLAMAESIYGPDTARLMRGMEGKRLSEMDTTEKALAVRMFDEARGKGNRPYAKITPEGDYGDPVLAGGKPRQMAWQNQTNIEKAIGAAQSGGDRATLSDLMGGRHKVRNFYNNIVAPKAGEQFGDITADTHQIAASLLRPLGGAHRDVSIGLGGAPSSTLTGSKGLYPVYADATRHAAEARGEPVRAMQSIPWEGVRTLFPDTFKTAKNQQIIDDIWRSYDRGEITADKAREHVIQAAGGFRQPTW